jgi:hypothetical protein
MSGWTRRSTLAPWSGLFLGAAAWFGQHQAGSDLVYWDCQLGGPLLTGGLGLVCGLITVAGGVVSWRAHQAMHSGERVVQNRRVSGVIGTGAAGIFLLAIVFQSLIGFIVPVCQR